MTKSTDEMVKELYTVILGVPSTGEKGMAYLVYEMEKQLREMNGNINTNTAWRKAMCWVLGLLVPTVGVLTGLIITKVL